MSVASPPAMPGPDAVRPQPATVRSWPVVVAWGTLIALLAVNGPAFVCLGLDSDIQMYDLCARRVLAGDVHYRDLLETNFPGIVWAHMAVRTLFGWRPEALRAADLAVVFTSVWLLTRWLPRAPAWGRVGAAVVLLSLYLSTNEWCHVQRDVWMLLPALIALQLRMRQVRHLTEPAAAAEPQRGTRRPAGRAAAASLRFGLRGSAGAVGWAALEGALWAAACWIKPFVVVPALIVWLVSAREVWRTTGFRHLASDFAGLLIGGLAVGAAGVGWLVATGAWPAFYEVMFVWNQEYFTHKVHGDESRMAPVWMAVRFFPWILVHLFAVPLALAAVWRGGKPALLSALYLGWLIQAVALQHVFDYVHVPPLFLGLTVLAADALNRARDGGGRPVLVFLAVCVLWSGYGVWAARAGAWSDCVTGGSTPELRDRLTLMRRVSATDLGRVADYLRAQDVQPGEVTCFSLSTIGLYADLDLPPSTRYLFLHDHLDIFASRRPVIHQALIESRQRFVVVDLNRYKTDRLREILNREGGPPADYRWADRIVFRSGSLVVFRLAGSEMPGWLAHPFGL